MFTRVYATSMSLLINNLINSPGKIYFIFEFKRFKSLSAELKIYYKRINYIKFMTECYSCIIYWFLEQGW